MKPKYVACFEWHTGIPDGEKDYDCLIPFVEVKETNMQEILTKALFTYNQTQTKVRMFHSEPFQFERVIKFSSYGNEFYMEVESNEYTRPLHVSVKLKPVLVHQNVVFEAPIYGKNLPTI